MDKHSIVDAKNVLVIGVKCPAMKRIVAVSIVSVWSYICSIFYFKHLLLQP